MAGVYPAISAHLLIEFLNVRNSEWGYISLSEITAIPVMNIDYYFEEQSIDADLYRQYPGYFKKLASLEK
jgi:hypothetical protein